MTESSFLLFLPSIQQVVNKCFGVNEDSKKGPLVPALSSEHLFSSHRPVETCGIQIPGGSEPYLVWARITRCWFSPCRFACLLLLSLAGFGGKSPGVRIPGSQPCPCHDSLNQGKFLLCGMDISHPACFSAVVTTSRTGDVQML